MNTRRIIAFLLACMMILTLVPGVFAEEEHTHEWVETVMKKADCEHTGVLKKECECGEVIYELIDLAHEKEERIVEATCTVEASIEVVCILCEKVLETKVIDDENNVPLGHDLVVDKDHEDYKGETCTEGGVAPMKCTRCDYTETQTPSAHGHKWSEDGVHTDAHCDHGAGLEYICTVCGDTKVEEYTEGDKVEEAIGHEFEEEVIAPTCEDEGYTLVTCKNCDYEEKKDTVPADPTAHSSVLDVMLKAPTCTVSGTGKYKCELCEADLGYKVIPAGHTWTEVEGTKTPATCGKDGKVDVICSVCGESEEQVLPALSDKHNFVETATDATCTEPSMIGMICTNCGAVDGELTKVEGGKPLGHDLVVDKDHEDYKGETCTEGGVAP
ncbi:MAG: hypothetical protein IKM46_06600, partial [Clostridia bacterium]|nr:hypothetical protein [Clostridia bacterium]